MKRPWHSKTQKFVRDAANRQIYSSSRWTRLSLLFRKQNPLCVNCLKNGIVEPSKVVDHIVPVNHNGAIWDTNNMQALCIRCHNTKSAVERNT